jgi:DNA-directed RNA polymerase subunit H (RpoH/RPB5)
MTILDKEAVGELAIKYNLKSLEQLPEISRFDAQASAMSMRPGDVGCFDRESETALTYEYYRICV